MSYNATVYKILIASPSDVYEEREITTRVIQNWNDVNSSSKKIVLLPLKWETHSSPTFDIRPQEAINTQLVDSADLVIGLFWAKIGSETGKEISGTIEEIKRAAKNGKDVMIYFSKRGIDPSLINIEQLRELNKFKEEVYRNALVENFDSAIDFRDKLTRQLEYKIKELQKNNTEINTNLNISFINKENGELQKDKLEVKVDKIDIDLEEINKISKDYKSIIKDREADFRNNLNNYCEIVNTLPIVLGIKNSDNLVYNNLIIDLQVIANITNSMGISVVGSVNDQGIKIKNGQLSHEDEFKITKLYDDRLDKINPNTMNVATNPLTILPNKTKCIKPMIMLYPSKNVNVNFVAKIHSESLLEPIKKTLYLKIKLNKRKITKKEILDVIDNLIDYSSLPF